MVKKFVKRLNLREVKEILNGYKDEDLERMAICLPCGADEGSDGGTQGVQIIVSFDDTEYDSPIFDLFETKGIKKLEKQFIAKLNYDFEFRNELLSEKVTDEDYEDFECYW